MAELILNEIISPKQKSALSKMMPSNLSIFTRIDTNGQTHLHVVPVKIATQISASEIHAEIWVQNLQRDIYYSPEFFDFSGGFDIIRDVCVPVRRKVKQAVIFTPIRAENVDGVKSSYLRLESADTYIEGRSAKEMRKKELPLLLKEELFDEATISVANFFESKMKYPQMIIEAMRIVCGELGISPD